MGSEMCIRDSSKGLIIENRSSYNLLYKDSNYTCGKPGNSFEDILFNNKCIPPNTAIAQFWQATGTKITKKHPYHVLACVSFTFMAPEDNQNYVVALGFSTGKRRVIFGPSKIENTAGVQIRMINSTESTNGVDSARNVMDMEKLARMHDQSKEFNEKCAKIKVECFFDFEDHSNVHFKFSNHPDPSNHSENTLERLED